MSWRAMLEATVESGSEPSASVFSADHQLMV